jgi:sugar phosphate isomerase/epimerase
MVLTMKDIIRKIHIHMPFDLLPYYQDMIIRKKMNLEIYFSQLVLNRLDIATCRNTAKLLIDSGIKITFHAPFMDLRPGALDDRIRNASVNRLRQAFDLVPYFHPLKIVCHPSFDRLYYVSCDEEWLKASTETWFRLISMIDKEGKTKIALENVYEWEPSILRRLFENLDSDRICFCFDTGHFNVFARSPLKVWLDELGKYLGHLHLHDNNGDRDEHLPVGNGTFPFEEFFQALREIKAAPTMTLEAHSEAHLWQSLGNINKIKMLTP